MIYFLSNALIHNCPLSLSGFGLLESGSVSSKNEVNIMVKNAVDVIFGGLSYWAFGYAFSFGTHEKYVTY